MTASTRSRSSVVLLVALVLALPAGARGDSSEIAPYALPVGRSSAAAVWIGSSAYVFGGHDPYQSQILRIDPAAGAVTVLPTQFPFGITQAAAVTDGTHAYIVGGDVTTSPWVSKAVYRFTPSSGELTQIATLPHGLSLTAAAWHGASIYAIGGWRTDPYGYSDQIIRIVPETGEVRVLDERMPYRASGSTAISDGQSIYVFAAGRKVVRIDPVFETVEELGATLFGQFELARATFDGRNAIIAGGWTGEIIKYVVSEGRFAVMRAALPSNRFAPAVVWSGSDAYVIGGFSGGTSLSQVVRYSLTPEAPQEVTATGGVGSVTLRWSPPPDDTYSWLIEYRAARKTGSGEWQHLASVASGETYIDDTCPLFTDCRYRVTAVSVSGESPASNETCARATPWVAALGSPCTG